VEYHWVNPATKKIALKKSYLRRVEGTDLCVPCGIFE